MLDGLIATWGSRASTDRNAAALVERLLRQREALAAAKAGSEMKCSNHLEATAVQAALADLLLYVGLEVTRNLHTDLVRMQRETLTERQADRIERDLQTCAERITWLFQTKARVIGEAVLDVDEVPVEGEG